MFILFCLLFQKLIPSLNSPVFPTTSAPSSHLPHPSPSSLGESGLGHESEGAGDLTHLLLSLNTISFQVVHWDAIVFLISPQRRTDRRRGRRVKQFSLWIKWPILSGVGWMRPWVCVSAWEVFLCIPRFVCVVLWVYGMVWENVCVFPLWLMPEWDHRGWLLQVGRLYLSRGSSGDSLQILLQ